MRCSRSKALSVLVVASLFGACSGDGARKTLGDTCREDDECRSGRCDELLCKSASPQDEGGACSSDYECRSENCLSSVSPAVCGPGQRANGATCSDELQCASASCVAGSCAVSHADGGAADGGSSDASPPSDAGSTDAWPRADAGVAIDRPNCSMDGWCWLAPLPQGNALWGIWGSSSSDIYAAGARGTLLHFDGSAWWTRRTGTKAELRAVWGSSATNIYFAGLDGAIYRDQGRGLEVAYQGLAPLQALWGLDATTIFAGGIASSLLRFDGTSWSPTAGSGFAGVEHIWGTSATNVYFCDAYQLKYSDGASVIVALDGISYGPEDSHFEGVWGASATNVIALRANWDWSYDQWETQIFHRQGTAWVDKLWLSQVLLTVIWGAGPTDVHAVGGGKHVHYDGVGWTERSGVSPPSPRAIWGDTATNVYTVGPQGAIWRYDGSAWSPFWSGNRQRLLDVWAASAREMVFVGEGGTVVNYDGSSFRSSTLDGLISVVTVAGSATDDLYAAGRVKGDTIDTIYRYDGSRWSELAGAPTDTITAARALGPADLLVTTNRGEIHRYRSGQWNVQAKGLGALTGLWVAGPSEAFAVGRAGTIVRFDGTSWTPMSSQTSVDLAAISGSDPRHIIAVGASGATVTYDGSAWRPVLAPTTSALSAVWVESPTRAFAAGSGGTLIRFDGSEWQAMDSGTGVDFEAIRGDGSGAVYVAGAGGAVLRYGP